MGVAIAIHIDPNGTIQGKEDLGREVPQDIDVLNVWTASSGGRAAFYEGPCERIDVYAGSKLASENPHQGILKIIDGPRCIDSFPSSEYYLTPLASGAVRIVSAANRRLTLVSMGGDEFVFDVPSRQWIGLRTARAASASNNGAGFALLPLQPDKLHHATRGMIVEYGTTGEPFQDATFLNQWYQLSPMYSEESAPFRWPPQGDVKQAAPGRDGNIRLYAGSTQSNYEQGLLVVADYSGGPDAKVERYLSPRKAGPLSIKDVSGELVTLSAQGGERLYFDLLWRQWTDATCARPSIFATRFLELATKEAYHPYSDAIPMGEGLYRSGERYVDSVGKRLRVMPTYNMYGTDGIEVAAFSFAGTSHLPNFGYGDPPISKDRYGLPGGTKQGVYILDAVCQRLTLGTRDGKAFYFFDVPTRQWVTPPAK